MPVSPWAALNLVAWAFGLKAVYDLRAEFTWRARTWALLTWAVWSCLLMELAMATAPAVAAVAVFATLSGIVAGLLLWLSFLSFSFDASRDQGPRLFDRDPDGRAASGLAALAALAVLLTWMAADTRALIEGLRGVEGLVWVVVAPWIVGVVFRLPRHQASGLVHQPVMLGSAFIFAFAHSALTPVAWLTGRTAGPDVNDLLSSLFVLTLVTTLYAMVLHHRGLKLAEALRQIQDSQQRLFGIEKVAAVGTLAAGAAHDFNNSLTSILGFAELLMDDRELSAAARESVAVIHQSARAAAAVVKGLMGIARRSSAADTFTDAREAVGAPLDSLAREFARHGIAVHTQLAEAPPVRLDHGLLFQVCLNLYLNARDAMVPGGGKLVVALRTSGPAVELVVQDTGRGIPAEFRSRMFQPLQTTKGTRGTGLGLSASKSIVESAGGTIRFESIEGHGTTFYVTLPMRADEADPATAAAPTTSLP